MYIFWIAVLVLSFTPLGKTSQVPLKHSDHDDEYLPLESDIDLWNLHDAPFENSTSHLIFDTINSLLQHWTNTRYRNGHTIVPATIPEGTIIYHGTYFNRIPINPEWVATDTEHARYFCIGRGTADNNRGCWQLTLVVKSPLKILYLDGSSAAMLEGGPLDAQDILLWGKSRPDMLFAEYIRICKLCEWGSKYGIHGFMRMQVSFEIMLCDFTKDVEVVSFLNLATDVVLSPDVLPDPSNVSICKTLEDPPLPRQTSWSSLPIPEDMLGMAFDAIEVGTWHSYYPGDTRVRLDLSRAISFYDTDSFPSLVPLRYGKERWYHRVGDLSTKDVQTLRNQLDEILAEDQWEHAASVDWRAQFHVITNRYAERLEILRYMVTNITDTQRAADRAFDQLRKLLSPYRLHTAVPDNTPSTSTRKISNHSWAIPVFKLCATTHTDYLAKLPNLTSSEKMLLSAMEDVNKEICRVLVKLWAEGIEWGLVPWKEVARTEDELRKLLDGWKVEVDLLMKWLDWSVWARCPEPCGPEEMCYMPTWPFFTDLSPTSPNKLEARPWLRPQPRCVRKFSPYNDIFT
ncbi:hypothetical protein BDQ17DRAFT_1350634 [Cyathus striatus]|nr:hypothetical protein BDQ17DRAFT_1350634 [Cyathus striatus]